MNVYALSTRPLPHYQPPPSVSSDYTKTTQPPETTSASSSAPLTSPPPSREVSALQTTILFPTRQQSTKPEQITLIGSLSRLTPETSGKEPGSSMVRIEPVKSGNIARRSRNCSKSTALTCSPRHVSGMWWLMCSQTSRGRSMGTLSSHGRISRPTATSA